MTLLAPKHAALRIGISVSRLVQLDRERVLPALRDSGNRRIYDAEAVDAYATVRERARLHLPSRSPNVPTEAAGVP